MSAYELAQLNIGIIKGPTAEAFMFRQAFPPPDAHEGANAARPSISFGDECPAT